MANTQHVRIRLDRDTATVELDGRKIRGVQKVAFSTANVDPRGHHVHLVLRCDELVLEGGPASLSYAPDGLVTRAAPSVLTGQ